jgi:hypothetical protein
MILPYGTNIPPLFAIRPPVLPPEAGGFLFFSGFSSQFLPNSLWKLNHFQEIFPFFQ